MDSLGWEALKVKPFSRKLKVSRNKELDLSLPAATIPMQ